MSPKQKSDNSQHQVIQKILEKKLLISEQEFTLM